MTPFACIQCSRAFSQAEHLKQHVRTHAGEKPLACTHGSKAFSRADKGPYRICGQFQQTLFERLEHHPTTHPYKRTSVIKVSDEISEMYLTL